MAGRFILRGTRGKRGSKRARRATSGLAWRHRPTVRRWLRQRRITIQTQPTARFLYQPTPARTGARRTLPQISGMGWLALQMEEGCGLPPRAGFSVRRTQAQHGHRTVSRGILRLVRRCGRRLPCRRMEGRCWRYAIRRIIPGGRPRGLITQPMAGTPGGPITCRVVAAVLSLVRQTGAV